MNITTPPDQEIRKPIGLKQTISSQCFFFSIFELGGLTKHLMTGPAGIREFCFPSTSMFCSALSGGTVSVSGKQNSLFPLGPVTKCSFSTSKLYFGIITFYAFMQNAMAPSKIAW